MIDYDDWLEQEEAAVLRMWERVVTVAAFLAGITALVCYFL